MGEKSRPDWDSFFRILRTRPDMLLSGDPHLLDSYIMFFEGFFISLKMFSGIDAERELSAWFQGRVDIKAPNLYWFAQFKLVERAKTEQEQIDSLLTYLESFLKDHLIEAE